MNKDFSADFIDKLNTSRYSVKDPENFVFRTEKGLSRSVVGQISEIKNEPEWMYQFRMKALEALSENAHAGLGP